MSQNRSHAVMAQRQGELIAQAGEDFPGQAKLDDFPTQPWGGRAVCEALSQRGLIKQGMSCWEPAANRGFLARGLRDTFGALRCSDVHDYGVNHRFEVRNFLNRDDQVGGYDWIITNPPFVRAEEFCKAALGLARVGIAMLVRMPFLESVGRYERLYSTKPPSLILQMVERLPMVRGRCLKEASTATAYCWVIWSIPTPTAKTDFAWIAPCRARLERDDDYEVAA